MAASHNDGGSDTPHISGEFGAFSVPDSRRAGAALTYPAHLRGYTLVMAGVADRFGRLVDAPSTAPSASPCASQSAASSTPHCGAAPAGFHTVVEQLELAPAGAGSTALEAAWVKVVSWRMHNGTWAKVGDQEEAYVGQRVVISFGPTHSPCQVVRLVDTPHLKALVYGTLPGHVESGEEAFILRSDCDGRVLGQCVAFSTAQWWPARLAGPVARQMQRMIARQYLRQLRQPH